MVFLFRAETFFINKLIKIKNKKMKQFEIKGDLDRSWIVTLMAEGLDTYQILKNYDITEDTIEQCPDLFEKEVLLQGFNFSEKFIRQSLENEYFSQEDLQKLSMTSYSTLSNEFIQDYKEKLNWTKIIIYLSTQTNSFSKYLEIINENNLWSLISANELPTEFIREHKDKLDWSLLSMVKCFTDEEKQEFSEFIVETKRELTEEELKSFGGINPVTDYEKNYSVDEIADLIDKYMSENNKDFYINIDNN